MCFFIYFPIVGALQIHLVVTGLFVAVDDLPDQPAADEDDDDADADVAEAHRSILAGGP